MIVLYNNKSECCGCGACYEICARNAIEMIEDNEGFLYPQISKDKCVECGMCIKVCAFKKDKVRSIAEKNS